MSSVDAAAFVVAADGALHSCSISDSGELAVRSVTKVAAVPNYFAVPPLPQRGTTDGDGDGSGGDGTNEGSGPPQLLYAGAGTEIV